MSSLKRKAIVQELSKGTFIGRLLIQHGNNKRELCTPKGTKSEVLMALAKMPEYAKKPMLLTLQ